MKSSNSYLTAKKEILDVEIESMEKRLVQLKEDFGESEKNYSSYITTLNETGQGHAIEIGRIKNSLYTAENVIRELKAKVQGQKLTLEFLTEEKGIIDGIQYKEKLSGLQNGLENADKHRQEAQNALSAALGEWSSKMSLFENRFNERRQQKEEWIREIETLLDDLKANSETIVSLLHQRDLLS